MLLVLVFGISASFASDAEDSIQATGDEVDETVSAGEIETVSASDTTEKTTSTANETLISASDDSGDKLGAGTGTFTDLQDLINKSYGKTITLDKDYTYDSSKDSSYVNGIPITDTITIDGNGKTLNANNLARIFTINANNVVLKNLKFINGYYTTTSTATNPAGSAIYWTGSYGTMTNCDFTNCKTWKPNGCSGAVHIQGSYNFITKCNFDKCIANYTSQSPDGSSISISGTYNTVDNCNFTNCYSYGSSGALFPIGQYNTIQNSWFENCSCTTEGGGAILAYAVGTKIINSTFKNNKCYSSWGGGAIDITHNEVVIEGCTFIDNYAKYQGGAVDAGAAYASISNCGFEGNTANTTGGAVNVGGTYATIENCEFTNNEATTNGGAVSVTGTYASVGNCEFNNNEATTGGALYVTGNEASITESSFSNNKDTQGSGALYVGSGKTVCLDELTYKTSSDTVNTTGTTQLENRAFYIAPVAKGKKDGSDANNAANWTYAYEHIGAGNTIYFTQGIYTDIIGQTISKSLNLIGLGTVTIDLQKKGRAFAISSPHSTIDNVDFINGYISGNGAIISWSGTYGTITNSDFKNSVATGIAGAVYWSGAYGTFTNNKIDNISSNSGSNTGALNWRGSYGNITNVEFKNCKALSSGTDGAALCLSTAPYTIVENCYFENNEAYNDGSAIIITDNSNYAKIINSTFYKNKCIHEAASRGTISIWANVNNIEIIDCKFIENQAYLAGAIYVNSAGHNITGCEFTNNIANTTGGAIYSTSNINLVDDCQFNGNEAVNGSAIYLNPNRSITIAGSTFKNNVATGEGTVYLGNNTKATLEDNTFQSNTGGTITTVGEVTSDLLFIRQGATGSGLIESDPTNWTYAINHINNGGKIVFLQSTYSDLIKRLLFQFSKVVL